MGMYSRIQGTLAKPSGKTRTVAQAMRSNRHAKATDRYQELKAEIHRWHKDGFKVAEYLREVRDDKLYVKEYSSFEEFCLEEFGWKRSQAYALAAWAEIKRSLPSAIADSVRTESQARALVSVPKESRAAVLEQVAAAGPITAKAIRAVAVGKAIDIEPGRESQQTRHCPTCTCPMTTSTNS